MTFSEYQNLPFNERLNMLRNTLVSLRGYHAVSLVREADVCHSTGEDNGEWEVEIVAGRRSIRVKADSIEKALIEADHKATAAEDEAQKARDAARAAALAKLSHEERRLLGVA